MKPRFLFAHAIAGMVLCSCANAQNTVDVVVVIENIAPDGGVAITPVWGGFHSGSFDSYNGGLASLEGLERVAEDGDTSVVSAQFNDFNANRGGYTYIDNTGDAPASRLVRTGDLSDANRKDATIGSAPLLPDQTAMSMFELTNDGSNDYFSYLSMVLPTNDFFLANGNPLAHDVSGILDNGGEISFLIGTPNGGVNDAGTEREDFRFSAGNPLFPNRNLPAGQSGPNTGRDVELPIANVTGDAFAAFPLILPEDQIRIVKARLYRAFVNKLFRPFRFLYSVRAFLAAVDAEVRRLEDSLRIDVAGFNFNQYEGGIARVTIMAVPR